MAEPILGKVRIIDIAHRVGVSKATVACVLNHAGKNSIRVSDARKQQILEVAREMHYVPNHAAQTLAGRSSNVIGVLIDTEAPFPRLETLSSIEAKASLRGYRCMVGESHNSLETLRHNYDTLMQYGVDGIICLSHDYPNTEHDFRRLFRDTLDKIVFIDAPNIPEASYINIDRTASTIEAVKHLHEQGARRIAYVREAKSWKTSQQTETGYRIAMQELGYAEQDLRIIITEQELLSRDEGPSLQRLSSFIRQEITGQRIDGLIGLNDISSLALIKALGHMGIRCPDDIAIVGCDNERFSQYASPALTTIDEDHESQADIILDLLLDKIKSPGSSLKGCFKTIIPKLIIRDSTHLGLHYDSAKHPLIPEQFHELNADSRRP